MNFAGLFKKANLMVMAGALLCTASLLALTGCAPKAEEDKIPDAAINAPNAPNVGKPPTGTIDPHSGQVEGAAPQANLPLPGNKGGKK